MRNRLFLLTATVVLSACADDQHATAPASRSGLSSRSAAGNFGPGTQGAGLPSAKPTDQVGFTKVFVVRAAIYTIVSKGDYGTATATCPAGSVVIAGSYRIPTLQSSAGDFAYVDGGVDGNNGWFVKGFVPPNALAAAVTLDVAAICIQ
jgi:hypothetical protein